MEQERKDGWAELGSRKKLTIGKGYPNFAPDRGLERSQGPVPCRWSFVLVSLVLTAAPRPDLGSTPEPEPTAEPVQLLARTPESFTEYEMSEVYFRVDGEFQYGRCTFLDCGTGTSYRIYTQYGVDAEDAWDTLTQNLSKYHAERGRDPGQFDAQVGFMRRGRTMGCTGRI